MEVAQSSLGDDQGEKRLLYEDLGVREGWMIDVTNVRLLAFERAADGSRRIQTSIVLPGLDLALVQRTLAQTRQMDHGKVSAWLLQQLQ